MGISAVAAIGMFAKQWHEIVDEVVVVDDHITGVLSEHQAGQVLGVKPTGIRIKGRRSTPGRYFQVADPGRGWGGTDIEDPLTILGEWKPDAAWPGWLFYASTQANARNSIFRDIPALNAYITRCQGVLQAGRPDQDVLLYWPVYDLWMSGGGREQRFSVHHPEWIEKTTCGEAGRWLIDRVFSPGASLDWRGLIEQAAGEALNPRYFVDSATGSGEA